MSVSIHGARCISLAYDRRIEYTTFISFCHAVPAGAVAP